MLLDNSVITYIGWRHQFQERNGHDIHQGNSTDKLSLVVVFRQALALRLTALYIFFAPKPTVGI